MRELDQIDAELRLLRLVRRTSRQHGGKPASRHVDALLDERRLRTALADVRADESPVDNQPRPQS